MTYPDGGLWKELAVEWGGKRGKMTFLQMFVR